MPLIKLNDAHEDDRTWEPWTNAITAARAALAAAPEGEPSDEELRDLWSWSSGQDQGPWPTQYHCFARAVLARWGRPAAPPAPLVDLPPDYIDEWITNPRDRSLLEVFHKACNSEGGSADEVILRGLKAVLHDDLSRSHRLQQENHRFREPERTILCDILANGTLLPDPDGTRYWDPSNAPAVVPVAEPIELPGWCRD